MASAQQRLARLDAALAVGRPRGAQAQALAATLRRNLIGMAVRNLMTNPDVAQRWRSDAIVAYLFDRQREMGLRRPYSRSVFERLVRAALARARA